MTTVRFMENIVLLLILVFCALGGGVLWYSVRLCTPHGVPRVAPGGQPTTTVRQAGASEAITTTTVTYTLDQPLDVIRTHYAAEMERRCVLGTIQERKEDTPRASATAICVLGSYDGAESAHTFTVTMRAVTPVQTQVIQEAIFSTKC
jgi:hypothetical protein